MQDHKAGAPPPDAVQNSRFELSSQDSESSSDDKDKVKPESSGASPNQSDSKEISWRNSFQTTSPRVLLTSGNPSIFSSSPDKSKWDHLPRDIQFYLQYHETSINFHHYLFKHDADSFLHTYLLEEALSFEPLLYGVVGFAAFQLAISKGSGQIRNFFAYYNRSVTLLRESLSRGDAYTDATLLTALQLATFEEYLGDWVNILNHQQAAHRMLVELYTPATVIESDHRRKMLDWYFRFDLSPAFMSGNPCTIDRIWFAAIADYFACLAQEHPHNIDYKLEDTIWAFRVKACDMAATLAQYSSAAITLEDLKAEYEIYETLFETWQDHLDPVFSNVRYQSKFLSENAPDTSGRGGLFQPDHVYIGPLATFNYVKADVTSMRLMMGYRKALILKENFPPELTHLAFELCKSFESIELFMPPEALVKAQGLVGVAALFLGQDARHALWCRQKFALIENRGHIFPEKYRTYISETFGDPEIRSWWLPNDGHYLGSVARGIRSIQEQRRHIDGRKKSQDLRNMAGIFSELSVGECTDV